MRDHQCRAVLHELLKRGLDPALRLVVERRGGFVEDQNRRILEHRTRDRQSLTLSARQPNTVVADHGLHAVRQACHEIMKISRAQGGRYGLWRRVAVSAIGHICGDRVVKEHDLLTHPGDLSTQAGERELLDRNAVEEDPALAGRMKSGNQIGERGLAAARRPDQRHGLARGHAQIDATQRRPFTAGILESDTLEHDFATRPLDGSATVIWLKRRIDEREYHFRCGQGTLQIAVDIGQMLERRQQHQHGGQKRHEAANRGLVGTRLNQRDRHHHSDRE